ncbi:MAG: Rieske 2Fe-2S domain-containing protein [Acidobacteria bacterium]|nr:Rieske 2Fe-2S domain-containing protein [Acidobacteriota bacterium]
MRDCESARGCACVGRDDRRDFLKHAAALVAGAVAGLGATARSAGALPIAFGRPLEASGNELTYPIPAADGATIDRDNGVIVVRNQGQVFAFNLSCPHENAAVRWKAALGRFECSRHDSQYTPAGVYTSGRATRNMDRFPVKKNGSTLVVDVSRLIQSDQQKAAWDGAAVPA